MWRGHIPLHIINMQMKADITGILVGVASIISSILFGYLPNKRNSQIERLRNRSQTLMKDVKAFYEIEAALVKRLAEATGKNETTLKKEVRQEVREKMGYSLSSYTKPSMNTLDK